MPGNRFHDTQEPQSLEGPGPRVRGWWGWGGGRREGLLGNYGNASSCGRQAQLARRRLPPDPSTASAPGALLVQPVTVGRRHRSSAPGCPSEMEMPTGGGGAGGARGKGRGLRNQSRDLQALARAIQKGFLKEGSVSQTSSRKVAPHLFHDLFSICLPTDSCLLKSVYLKTESLLPSWKWRAACTCHK